MNGISISGRIPGIPGIPGIKVDGTSRHGTAMTGRIKRIHQVQVTQPCRKSRRCNSTRRNRIRHGLNKEMSRWESQANRSSDVESAVD